MAAFNGAAPLVAQYNSAEQQLQPLRNADDNLRNIDGQISCTNSEVQNTSARLSQKQKDQAYLAKRIHRNEHPRFFHYLVCNREAKVQRLKEESEHNRVMEEQIGQALHTSTSQLHSLNEQRMGIKNAADRKHHLEALCQQLFNQVVDTQPPSPALQQLRANVQQCRSRLSAEQALLRGVGQSVQAAHQGQSLFQQAQNLYQQALNVNRDAQQVNRAEAQAEQRERRDDRRGDDFGAECEERRAERLERQERQLQSRRDNLINQAKSTAERAYQTISSAFTSFPMEARSRYPQHCASIGQVAFPHLKGANFSSALLADAIFGTMGAAVNDYSSGCKIQDNMNVMQQCLSITNQQLAMINAVQAAISETVRQQESSIQHLEQQILTERTSIFTSVRSAVGSSAK